jgi:hypothetical protein
MSRTDNPLMEIQEQLKILTLETPRDQLRDTLQSLIP